MNSDESDLDQPLLGEGDQGPTTMSQNNAGGVTLNGDSINLRDLFPGATAAAAAEQFDSEENIAQAEDPPTSASTLSLGEPSTTPNPSPSTLDYMKQTIFYIPKRGRSFYYRTRYNVTTFIATRRSGGLTPVGAPPTEINDTNTTASRNSTSQTRSNKKSKRRDQITQKSSLFSSQTTPFLLKLLIPPLLITNHVLFYHGQTKPMWNLAYKTNITISATADTLKSKAAADALNVPHHYDYVSKESKIVETFTYMDAIRKLWDGEGLGDAQTISKVAAALLVIFSGIWPHLKLLLVHFCWFIPFAHGLWLTNNDFSDEGDGCEDTSGKCCCCSKTKQCCTRNNGSCKANTHKTKSRCSLCCSNGHSHKTHTVRSPFLRTLSTLGKWSLADVLVVCILIAVLHLDWQVNPHAIRTGIEEELPTLLDYAHQKYPDEVVDCTQLLGYTCGRHALVIHYPACVTCQTLIKNAYHHPEWTTNEGKDILEGITLEGGGYAQLRVQGMVGTYYFCGAVIMSILLSVLVDWLDERDRECVEEDLLDRKRELEFILPGESGGTGLGNELELRDESALQQHQPQLNEALMLDDDPDNGRHNQHQQQLTEIQGGASYARLGNDSAHIPTATTNCYLLKQALLALLSISSLPLVCYAVSLPTMQRVVYGGGPTLLHEVLGMIWEKDYSLITLVKTTGDAGGWDVFLMLTFGLFAVVGPIARSICLIIHVFLGLPVVLLGDCIERPRKRTTLRLVLYNATSALRRALLPVIDALGAFCCWEVLIVSLIMIQLEMPSITDTIYQDDRCQEADPEHGRTCIEVQFNALDNFLVVGVAWIVLIAASGLAMDLAGDADEKSHRAGKEEKMYEFGQSIPQRRANVNRSRNWLGSAEANNRADAGNDNEDEEQYFSPLQQGAENGGRNDLEQIVFL